MIRFIPGLFLLMAACGSTLPTKPTPARARIFIQVDAQPYKFNGFDMAEARWDLRLKALLRSELMAHRLGIPTNDPADADLILSGAISKSIGAVGYEFNWQLRPVDQAALVLSGTVPDKWIILSLEPFSTPVMQALLAADIDQYATTRGTPTFAQPKQVKLAHAPQARTRREDDRALVIAVERYRARLASAVHARADAEAFARYAQSALGIPAQNVKVLIGQTATRAEIEAALTEWLPQTPSGGRIFVYFSGHGAPDPQGGTAHLVPWDADPKRLAATSVGLEAVYDRLDALQARQSYVFLDACFSGAGARSTLTPGLRPLVPLRLPRPRSVIALTAAGGSQTAGTALDAAHGLFTRHLLDGLAGAADANADRDISWAELARHVQTAVERDARLDNRDQTPAILLPADFARKTPLLVEGLKTPL